MIRSILMLVGISMRLRGPSIFRFFSLAFACPIALFETDPGAGGDNPPPAGDREVLELIKQVRTELGARNTDIQGRLDEIQQAATQRDADNKALRAQIEELQRFHKEREATIREMQQRQRVQGIQADGISQEREGLRVLGMIGRRLLARHIGSELPSQFRDEVRALDEYTARVRETRATIEAGATGGSYLIPTITESMIIDTLEEVSDLVARTEFVPGLPGNVNIPTLTGRPTLQPARASVDTAMTASDPTFGLLQIQPDEAYIYFPADNRLLLMEAVSLGSLLQRLLRDSAIEGLADWILNGDGTSTYNSVTGILNESTAAYIYTLPATKTAFSDVAFTDLAGAISKALKRGRARGVFLVAEDVMWSWGDITRGEGKVPVMTFDAQGNPRVLGKPVVIDEGMPGLADTASDKAFFAFGDLSTYFVGLQGGFQVGVSTEYLFGKNQTAFRNVLNVDIKRKPAKTLILGKTAAA